VGKHKAVIYITITLVSLVLIAGVYQSHKTVQNHKSERLHDKQFHERLYSDFMGQLERWDKINNLVEYNKEKEENTIRFAELKGKPQVVWGTITTTASKDLGIPLRMRLRKKPSKTPYHPALNRTVVDDQLRFAFTVAEPGEYEVILYETSTCPGVRLENVTVKEGQPIPETVINIEDETIEVTARDAKGNAVVGGQVTVGKSDGGTNSNLFTWRKGLTDSKGKFFAENLTDGKYVIVVHTQRRNGSASVPLNTNEHKKISITMTHDNY
jgi:hypothetical protein